MGEVNPASAGWEVQLTDLRDDTVQDVRRSLLVLAGAVALVLFIACVNVANLLLVGGAARHRELAIRTAIGATRGRLLRQLVVEHAALAAISALDRRAARGLAAASAPPTGARCPAAPGDYRNRR